MGHYEDEGNEIYMEYNTPDDSENMMSDRLYWYNARLDRVVDGDSVYLFIDIGFGVHYNDNCRLINIDAPEIFRPDDAREREAGCDSKEALEALLHDADRMVVNSVDLDKYGRPLVDIYVDYGNDGGWIHVNNWMIENGFATRYDD